MNIHALGKVGGDVARRESGMKLNLAGISATQIFMKYDETHTSGIRAYRGH